jgi:Xaa-Pro aminopeptidase
MESAFFAGNRRKLYETLENGTVCVVFSGKAIRRTADELYPFYADRNFVYLTGIEQKETVLIAEKFDGKITETIFTLPPDMLAERWTGRRIKSEEITALNEVSVVKPLDSFEAYFHTLMISGKFDTVALDFYKNQKDDIDRQSHEFYKKVCTSYPFLKAVNIFPQLRKQRTIKQPCEIDAIKTAVGITRAGILAMMKASKPGMYEYEYKAEFDRELTKRGVLSTAFQSIISAGSNNFCIHYDAYTGIASDGDMVLNDVGAKWDFMVNDVSRGWPCNGKFTEKQRLLYECAYRTSEHMFSIIKPGMPMADVDRLAREFDYKQLHDLGLVDTYENAGKLIWHGGAHHIGFDTHDLVDMTMPVTEGMVFCVDIGIYCEEWGIGFRLEDNCLVTKDGCVNLTASIPRSIDEIEAVMAK